MRMDFGRPSSSILFKAARAMVTSVTRRRSVRERSALPDHAFEPAYGRTPPRHDDYTRMLSAIPCVHARGYFGDVDRSESERSPQFQSAPPLIGVEQ